MSKKWVSYWGRSSQLICITLCMHGRKATVLPTIGCSKARTLNQSPIAIKGLLEQVQQLTRIKTGCSCKMQGKLLSKAQKQLFRKKPGDNSKAACKQHSKL